MNSKKRYKKSNSREISLIDIQGWNEGDTQELKKWLNWNYEKHYFVNNNGIVDLYYEIKDGDDFCEIVKEKLKQEGFFDALCKDFLNNWIKLKEILAGELSKEDIIKYYNLNVKCWPAASIFDIISGYPELASESINQKMNLIRQETSEFFYKFSEKISKSIPKIYPEIQGFEEVILIQEIANGNFPLKEELEKRKKYYTVYAHFLETDLSFEQLSKEHEFEIVEWVLDGKNEVKGNIAMRGKARGIVKVIFKIEDVSKVEIGNILIAPMTTPEHIIAMDKASAFVTDEGGVACHAAIVAREFQKPCIVGTRKATKIFRDGDLVFVDADEGIVRKVI